MIKVQVVYYFFTFVYFNCLFNMLTSTIYHFWLSCWHVNLLCIFIFLLQGFIWGHNSRSPRCPQYRLCLAKQLPMFWGRKKLLLHISDGHLWIMYRLILGMLFCLFGIRAYLVRYPEFVSLRNPMWSMQEVLQYHHGLLLRSILWNHGTMF